MSDLTPDQLEKLKILGIGVEAPLALPSPHKKSSLVPLLSISGLTLISFGGLVLFKTRTTPNLNPISSPSLTSDKLGSGQITPTQVPKSIQHYLLTSQQYFTRALQAQSSVASAKPSGGVGSEPPSSSEVISDLNQSIIAASAAIKEFPSDYRGYEQRGRIYQSLIDSQPQLVKNALADLSMASQLNPDSADITRSLAVLYARQGDAKNTLTYLAQTVTLEPTKAQNFYDLAKIQQQTGLLPEALATYDRLISIVSDPSERTTVESERASIQALLAQNTKVVPSPSPTLPPNVTPTIYIPDNPKLIQAEGNDSGLIIAAPETAPDIKVDNLVDSNSLSGTAVLKSGDKQISLTNTNLKSTSQVYVTITKGGKNLTLQVLSRSGQNFTVGLDSPAAEDIEFKWWIINP